MDEQGIGAQASKCNNGERGTHPDGQEEIDRPMALVKEAIETKGFLGVKLYNSVGYRPLGNAMGATDHNVTS